LVIRSSQQKRLKPNSESLRDQADFPEPDMPISDIRIQRLSDIALRLSQDMLSRQGQPIQYVMEIISFVKL
jgi:hypothetical protein